MDVPEVSRSQAQSQYIKEVADAYEHIYDLAYLRAQPLLDRLLTDPAVSSKDRVWQFHHLLLDTIHELDPGPGAPIFSREWRRHRLLTLRYIDGLTPQAVADQLAISRRHYYREHESAIEALAELLAARMIPLAAPVTAHEPPTIVTDRLQLIRLEAAQSAQTERRADLLEVISGVLSLLADKMRQRGLTIHNRLDGTTPFAHSDPRLLRQLLLGVLAYLVDKAEDGAIDIAAKPNHDHLDLILTIADGTTLETVPGDGSTSSAAFEELATLCAATLSPLTSMDTDGGVCGFRLVLACYTENRTVLVIDDNEDILELFDRYLTPRDYDVVVLRTSIDLLSVAKRVHPSVIILDLMIPHQDGWDSLQILQQQPETQAVPIIICSVLRQKELALSLGATAFLEKPIAEDELIALLDALTL